MKRKLLTSAMILVVVPEQTNTTIGNGTVSYIIGATIGLFIMGYLLYSLLKPDKF